MFEFGAKQSECSVQCDNVRFSLSVHRFEYDSPENEI